jgi:hypothetical protein
LWQTGGTISREIPPRSPVSDGGPENLANPRVQRGFVGFNWVQIGFNWVQIGFLLGSTGFKIRRLVFLLKHLLGSGGEKFFAWRFQVENRWRASAICPAKSPNQVATLGLL